MQDSVLGARDVYRGTDNQAQASHLCPLLTRWRAARVDFDKLHCSLLAASLYRELLASDSGVDMYERGRDLRQDRIHCATRHVFLAYRVGGTRFVARCWPQGLGKRGVMGCERLIGGHKHRDELTIFGASVTLLLTRKSRGSARTSRQAQDRSVLKVQLSACSRLRPMAVRLAATMLGVWSRLIAMPRTDRVLVCPL